MVLPWLLIHILFIITMHNQISYQVSGSRHLRTTDLLLQCLQHRHYFSKFRSLQ
ncbi:hypothetical protein AAHE18_15G195500 [Arachis hypogaea]